MDQTAKNELPKEKKQGAHLFKPGNQMAVGSGGPKSRQNLGRGNIRHGLKAGSMPPGTEYIEIQCNKYRRVLEDAVFEQYGKVGVKHAGFINTAIRWERYARLAQRWLVKTDDLYYCREAAVASDRRDRAIEKLNLSDDSDIFAALRNTQPSYAALSAPNEVDHA